MEIVLFEIVATAALLLAHFGVVVWNRLTRPS
jgi:hypothetical protein